MEQHLVFSAAAHLECVATGLDIPGLTGGRPKGVLVQQPAQRPQAHTNYTPAGTTAVAWSFPAAPF